MKNVGKKQKFADQVVSLRLPAIAVMQLAELQDYTGENASRAMVRALGVLHDKYLGGNHELKPPASKNKRSREKSEND